MTRIRETWPIPDAAVRRFVEGCREVYSAANPNENRFDELVDWNSLYFVRRNTIHVFMGILGFSYGGGELLPIHLSNALANAGVIISVLSHFDDVEEKSVRQILGPGIPVYRIQKLRNIVSAEFFRRAGVDLFHTHFASIESVLLDQCKTEKPYLVTLHGSYEAISLPASDLQRWAQKIDLFAYLTERNLRPFEGLGVPKAKFVKVCNAMPMDDNPAPWSRNDLGVSNEAIVFTMVARGIEGKGWPQAVAAFLSLLNRRPDLDAALLLAGSGPETKMARDLAGGHPRIKFLGFQPCVNAIYRMSDVAIAPTRFSGGSFPLSLIQAMQVGTPIVATDIGEIATMITTGDERAGLLAPFSENNEVFVASFSSLMEKMLDPVARLAFSRVRTSDQSHVQHGRIGEYLLRPIPFHLARVPLSALSSN